MATFASFMDDAANLSVSADQRTYTITGDWNWDGALDDNAFPRGEDGVRIILSGSSAKLRVSAGASGTFGGYSQPIIVQENADAHAYPNDNGNPASPTDCRFVGAGTSVWDNVVWDVQPRSNARSDFDVGRNFSGTFRGFRLIQRYSADQNQPFNHIYSSNLKLEIGANGIGYSIRNERNAHAMIIESNPNAQFAGLASDNVPIPANQRNEGSTQGSSARIVVAIPANQTFTLTGLDTATLTQSTNNSTSVCILRDPVQVPTLTTNWDSPAGATMIIERTQDFNFNITGSAAGTLHAITQASQNGASATATIPANGQVGIAVRTHYVPFTGNSGGGTWLTAVDSYRFHAVGFGFDKWYSGNTNISVGTSPSTRSVNLSARALPDGTALSSKTSGAVETAADVINALATYEIANPTFPSLTTRLVTIGGTTATINTGELVLSTSASDFISRSSNTITLQADSGGVDASNDVGLLNLGSSYNAPSGTLNLINFPTTTSSGTSALINITAPISQVYAFTNAGVQLGNRALTSAGTTGFLIPASQALANTRVGCGRAGRPPQSRDIDISAGGTFAVEFQDLAAEVDANGDALYDSSLSTSDVSVAFTTSTNPGRATFFIGNASVSPKQIYKALHDQFSNPLGGRYVAFGRTPLQILELGGAIPPAVFLGGDTQLRRASSSGPNAAVNAFVLGGIGGNPVNEDRGPIQLGGSISTGGGGAVDLTEVNTKLDAITSNTETLQEQNEHLATSLPLTLHEPLSPLAIVTGLEGQEIIRDTEETDWPLTTSGTAGDGDPEAHGVVTFDGNNTHIDYSLNRAAAGETPDLYTSDIIVLMQINPSSFPASGQRPLANIGALTLSLNNSTGSTASLHLGAGPGATTTTAQVNLNAWNDLVFVFTQNPDRPNNPRVRVSINGSAQETGNLGADSTLGNNLFGPIASNTQNFRLGGHGTGSQTSGFQGQARAIFVHPDNEVFGTDGWDIPAGVYWNTTNQLWQGAQLMDRVEGIAVDRIERTINTIEEKTYTSDELGLFPWRAATSNLTSATGSIGKFLAELNNVSDSSVADAVLDEILSGHTTSGSLGAAISAIPTDTYTIPSVDDFWNASLASYTTAGSAGLKLSETSTHDAPADAPSVSDFWNHPIPNTPGAGTAIAKLDSLVNGPTAQQIIDAYNADEVETGISRLNKERYELSLDAGSFTKTGDRFVFSKAGGSSPRVAADVTDTGRTNVTLTPTDS